MLKPSPKLQLLCYITFGFMLMCSAVLIGMYANVDYSATRSTSTELYISASQQTLQNNSETSDTLEDNTPTYTCNPVVIDAGHGGEDGGASSESGILEKDLNLAVSDDVAHLCLLFGIPYKMTREDDRLLYDYYSELSDYTGKKKSLDLKNRLRISEEVGASLFFSIHMNKFPESRYSGLQVYYSPKHEDSRALAESVQSYTKNHLQNENERQPKAATSSIYLLNHLEIPAILVECGFLSNPEETALLSERSYRANLASVIFAPIAEYYVRSISQ